MGLTPALEEGGKVMVDNLEFKDCQEGIAAFVEKRKPNWCHTQEKFALDFLVSSEDEISYKSN